MLRDETIRRVIQFRDDREWRQFHTPRTWPSPCPWRRRSCWRYSSGAARTWNAGTSWAASREELADVLSYCVLMADVCGLDLDEILNAKVDQNAAKYPVEKARGSAAKYTELT